MGKRWQLPLAPAPAPQALAGADKLMPEALFSPYWYRVKDLKPRLHTHIEISRHLYRGEPWAVLQDSVGGRQHRFNQPFYQMLCMMDGQTCMADIWQTLCARDGDNAPNQDQTIAFLARLYRGELIRADVSPDLRELLQRRSQARPPRWKKWLLNPLSIRFPLIDPNRLLGAMLPAARYVFSFPALLLWLLIIVTALLVGSRHWMEIAAAVGRESLEPSRLIIIACIYPVLKLLHELAHGLATRRFGGEVHEMGIILLLLIPLPYVDASSSASFRNKAHRIAVSAAGIVVELLLAAGGLFLWLATEPGLIHSIAFNTMIVGSVATVLFNANPLLRYDGYYILADLIEIPNLGSRANQYLGYLVNRYIYRVEPSPSPVSAAGEKLWFLFYAIASFAYRLFLVGIIALLLAQQYFFIGVALALWAIFLQVAYPMIKQLKRLLSGEHLYRKRLRAIVLTAGCGALLALAIGIVPFPRWSQAQGVIWPAEHALIRASQSGFVQRFLTPPNSRVKKNQPLIELQDEDLRGELLEMQLRMVELKIRHSGVWSVDRVETGIIRDEIATLDADIARVEEQVAALQVVSHTEGIFVIINRDLRGNYARQGELLGYVLGQTDLTTRVMVEQADISSVREQTETIEVRIASHPGEILSARLLREVPQGSNQLPSKVLAVAGGGIFATDPEDPKGLQTQERLFQLELQLPPLSEQPFIGTRVFVRFDHGSEPLAQQWYRSLRRLFLSKFDV